MDKNGKPILLPNRVWNMVESLPTPARLIKLLRIGKDALVPDSCHCGWKNPANKNEFPTDHPRKPASLKSGDPNFKYEVIEKDGKHYIRTSDGREIPNKYFYTGEVTKTTKQGNTYTVTYDKNGFPDFEPHAKKDKDGNPIIIYLPEDAIVGASAAQTQFATKLLKERYVKKYGETKWKDQMKSEGFTDAQIESIDKGKGSIGRKEEGYANRLTWHHDVETGKMVLVPFDLNNTFKHTGGTRSGENKKLNNILYS
ncbi:HNH endonuclease [Thermoactinomyces mirandus]|uniref:HNH endonuclease n=1 Tax=Thermoactinomyces mirandus TaxID=2756294 RepID=A0A7W1XPV6_9BACL|nr:HNH endonuclease [Thermoactinomyces mirandus]MBA4600977.1 HNH endonuclease [Thermoactinomyces mirandus]